ncbi:MAG: hypothetical protein HC888_02890 [Candidatus Competibacteraceae bacterium]|nr:hypothetical protein [Candidatus Competibacteraceae bacterium]
MAEVAAKADLARVLLPWIATSESVRARDDQATAWSCAPQRLLDDVGYAG